MYDKERWRNHNKRAVWRTNKRDETAHAEDLEHFYTKYWEPKTNSFKVPRLNELVYKMNINVMNLENRSQSSFKTNEKGSPVDPIMAEAQFIHYQKSRV